MRKIFLAIFTLTIFSYFNLYAGSYENYISALKDPATSKYYNLSSDEAMNKICEIRKKIINTLEKQYLKEFKKDKNITKENIEAKQILTTFAEESSSNAIDGLSKNVLKPLTISDNFIESFEKIIAADSSSALSGSLKSILKSVWKTIPKTDSARIYDLNSVWIYEQIINDYKEPKNKIQTLQILAALEVFLEKTKKIDTTDQYKRTAEISKIQKDLNDTAKQYRR
ncbi:hypothetical protein AAIR98_001097 [Elusimicrobium simillimum]|uniref:hypothetical protein n=1 Tax=Elusimicrobium simillimum TaxID=3143438 RepID=UPI003C6ED702